MKKLFGILIAIIVILAGLGTFAYLNSGMVLANIISHKTLTPITIHHIDWKKGGFTVEELTIKNPKEARLPVALNVRTIDVEAPYNKYFESPIEIDKIHIDNVYVNVQIYNKERSKGNWHTLLSNMAIDHNSPLSIERPTLIKKLILTNIQVDLILSDGSMHRLSPIARLEFDNLSTEKGIPTQEISEIIVQKMMHSIFLEKGIKVILEAPIEILRGVFPFL